MAAERSTSAILRRLGRAAILLSAVLFWAALVAVWLLGGSPLDSFDVQLRVRWARMGDRPAYGGPNDPDPAGVVQPQAIPRH